MNTTVGRRGWLIAGVAALVLSTAVVLAGHKFRRPPQMTTVAALHITAIETDKPDAGTRFAVVIEIEGGRAVTVPVHFVSGRQEDQISAEDRRRLLSEWIRQRAVATGRMSGLDMQGAPTLYIDAPGAP